MDFYKEVKRMSPQLVVIGLAVLFIDKEATQLFATLYRLSMLALIIIIMHIGRKALFPYLDLETIVSKSREEPIGAAIVWAGICMFLCTFMFLAVVK